MKIWELLQTQTGTAALAGIAGGILRWVSVKENPRDGIATIIAGCICAIYMGPSLTTLFANWMSMEADDPQLVAGVSFIVGVGGISLGAFIVGLFKDRELIQAVKDAIIFMLTKNKGGPK